MVGPGSVVLEGEPIITIYQRFNRRKVRGVTRSLMREELCLIGTMSLL